MELTLQHTLFPLVLAFIAAAYAAVGQAGATGYIAAMGLAGFAPDVIRPAALALNTLVAAIGTARFARAGHLTWRATYPFILLGLPFSILGGATHLPAHIYKPVVGALLIVAAWQMARLARSARATGQPAVAPPLLASLVAGAAIGFVAGVTGIGGGIFVAPLVLWLRWLDMRHTAGLSALFNLLNSAAALAGVWGTSPKLPGELPWWLAAVAVGAALGSWLGVRHLAPSVLRYILAALLLAGGAWMLIGR
ncbi:MAG TPA: sulfite exporter TauE/SafE family protein [Xanthobacteraceae bacterium]|nr:sulfite exporter TauE/SafE family protein [Xanthobacteraceae bacterium]